MHFVLQSFTSLFFYAVSLLYSTSVLFCFVFPLSSFMSLYYYGVLKYTVAAKLPCILRRMSKFRGGRNQP